MPAIFERLLSRDRKGHKSSYQEQEVALGASVDVKTGDWLVVAFDNSTATVFGVASPGSGLANHGLSRTQSSAFPLPSTFTPAASGDRQVRLWGIP